MAAPPAPTGTAVVAVGAVLVLVAARMLLLRRPSAARTPLLGRLLLRLMWLVTRLDVLRRSGDSETLTARLAVAPTSWPARCVASALSVHGAAVQRDASCDPHPPPLADLVAAVRLLLAVALAAPTAVVASVVAGPPQALIAAASVAFIASRLPDLVLRAAARRAAQTAVDDTAATVDLLAATASAGLALPEAMVLTAGHAPPALAAVLQAAAVRRAIGEEPHTALAAEARRYCVPRLADVGQALERQRRLGVPLGDELARIAAQLRTDHRATALRRAARRGPLGTLVVALVVAPVCVAAVVACLIGGLLQSGPLTPQ